VPPSIVLVYANIDGKTDLGPSCLLIYVCGYKSVARSFRSKAVIDCEDSGELQPLISIGDDLMMRLHRVRRMVEYPPGDMTTLQDATPLAAQHQ
jgi:hypothetical protein